MCLSRESEPEPEPVSTPEPEPDESQTPAIIGVVFGTLGALIVIIALIVICLRKRKEGTKSKFKGFGLTTRLPNRNTVSKIDATPAYTGLGTRQSQYQYDIHNQSRTNAVDRNTYYSGYNYGASVIYSGAQNQVAGDKYVEIPLR